MQGDIAMALQGTQPDNLSFLSPTGFRFQIQKIPHVNYFCTSANIPDVSMGQLEQDNTFIRLPIPGDKLTFGQLDLNFQIDEDLNNFREIYDWLVSLGYPDNFQQRQGIQNTLKANAVSTERQYSDASLIITTAQYKPNVEVKFIDAYPINLGALEFNTTGTDIEYLQGQVSFAYRKYELTTIA